MAKRPVRTGLCSMTITINGVSYTVRPCSWNGGRKVYTVTKQVGNKACYRVGVGNGYFCNCPDNKKNKPEGGCKHIKALRALWLI